MAQERAETPQAEPRRLGEWAQVDEMMPPTGSPTMPSNDLTT